MLAGLLLAYLVASGGGAYASPGVLFHAPAGYVVSNIDPTLNSTLNNQIYDPNFIPGFNAGLENLSVTWSSGPGYARIGYMVGAWSGQGGAVPHMAVGPQCCNFAEVPHTQQFRLPAWGDYYYVRAGLGPPGVNIQNYTSSFGGTATYVGLRTDWNWTVSASLDWSEPVVSAAMGHAGALGIAATQYVANATGKLVYTLVDFWMDSNSSGSVVQSADGVGRDVLPPNLVVYHPFQISGNGNRTITIDLSWYLRDTMRTLGLQASQSQPPLISYVYLNIQGYNFRWNTTLWSFYVMAQGGEPESQSISWPLLVSVLGVATFAAAFYAVAFKKWPRRRQLNAGKSAGD